MHDDAKKMSRLRVAHPQGLALTFCKHLTLDSTLRTGSQPCLTGEVRGLGRVPQIVKIPAYAT